ncbi:MAG: hypothetical protein EHM70_24210 [Chloroflexota bacterium]|nr:MAG: hypothetical protein EHM70_24210 [Chloroflexota bacterium]
MNQDSSPTLRQILAKLRKTDTALTGKVKTQPVLVYRHGRWHMVTVTVIIDAAMEAVQGIRTVHFMSPYRARKTVAEWLPYSELTPFEEVCPSFQEEVAAKILPDANAYRNLLKNHLVSVAGGYTTDTLSVMGDPARDEDRLVARIEAMMVEGEMGPFLNFERSFQYIQEHINDN